MKRIAIIHAWFGSYTNFFTLWLNSCKHNSTIDFYILTDQNLAGGGNIIPIKTTLTNLKNQFEEYLGYNISLESPYKLCDYKVIFFAAVPDIEQKYDFWGYCDSDLIFGDIREFITDDILNRFPYIGVLGHFHLQKTNYELFKKILSQSKTLEGYTSYDVYSSPRNYLFDELPYGVPRQVIDACPEDVYSLFFPDHRCYECPNETIPGFVDTYNNADELGAKFKQTLFSRYSKEIDCWNRNKGFGNKKWTFYKYDNGFLRSCFWENGFYKEKDILYVHLFKRKMDVLVDGFSNSYSILPNKFIYKSVTKSEIKKAYAIDSFRCQKISFRRKWYNAKTSIYSLFHRWFF